jgi:hypothetical protein
MSINVTDCETNIGLLHQACLFLSPSTIRSLLVLLSVLELTGLIPDFTLSDDNCKPLKQEIILNYAHQDCKWCID